MIKKRYLAPKLKHRIQIQIPTLTENNDGGFDRGYTTITRIWAGIKELSDYSRYIRHVQTTNDETHEFIIRLSAVKNLGKEYSSAFSTAYDSTPDFNPIKSDYFIYLDDNSPLSIGRRFRIMTMKRDDNFQTYIKIRVIEIEEAGTGFPE
jgi:head-tail adaptor